MLLSVVLNPAVDAQNAIQKRLPCAAAGQRLGRYDILRRLGQGGMGSVYEARHVDLGNLVALKVLHRLDVEGGAVPRRVLREARAAAQLHHENVVRMVDIGTDRGLSFIVMERLDGDDLAYVLAQRTSLSVEEIADIFLPMTSAITAAHDAGILHRDIKPANIVLARTAAGLIRPVVTDFGICKILTDAESDSGSLTQSAALIGSIPYLSPEQTRGAKYATAAGDQYAMGVMLYECATGKRPFQGASGYDVMHAILHAAVVHPCELRPTLPRAFGDIIMRAMHRDPEKRFSSVQALGRALLPFTSPRVCAVWQSSFATDQAATSLDADIDRSRPGDDNGPAEARFTHPPPAPSLPIATATPSPRSLLRVARAPLLVVTLCFASGLVGHLITLRAATPTTSSAPSLTSPLPAPEERAMLLHKASIDEGTIPSRALNPAEGTIPPRTPDIAPSRSPGEISSARTPGTAETTPPLAVSTSTRSSPLGGPTKLTGRAANREHAAVPDAKRSARHDAAEPSASARSSKREIGTNHTIILD